MSDFGGNGTNAGDGDDGARIQELAGLDVEISTGFFDRLRTRIDRRQVTSQLMSLTWHVPTAVVLEFLSMIFELVGLNKRGEGGSQ